MHTTRSDSEVHKQQEAKPLTDRLTFHGTQTRRIWNVGNSTS